MTSLKSGVDLVPTIVQLGNCQSTMFVKLFATVAILAVSPAAAFVPRAPFVSRVSPALKMAAEFSLEASETAIVLIEYQNEFTTEGGKLHAAVKDCMDATGTLGNSRKLMDTAREAGCTIIHCPISFEKVC
jgi:hypothetical protein